MQQIETNGFDTNLRVEAEIEPSPAQGLFF